MPLAQGTLPPFVLQDPAFIGVIFLRVVAIHRCLALRLRPCHTIKSWKCTTKSTVLNAQWPTFSEHPVPHRLFDVLRSASRTDHA